MFLKPSPCQVVWGIGEINCTGLKEASKVCNKQTNDQDSVTGIIIGTVLQLYLAGAGDTGMTSLRCCGGEKGERHRDTPSNSLLSVNEATLW